MPAPENAAPYGYRERLRVEGAVLAGSGALGSVLLLALVERASDRAASTALQIVFVAVVLAVAGPAVVRRWLADAQPLAPGEEASGAPTALWKPPLVVVALTALVVVPGEAGIGPAGWDAALRITLGSMLVGLAQALLLNAVVAADERRRGRRYVRCSGSRALGGTKLGFVVRSRA